MIKKLLTVFAVGVLLSCNANQGLVGGDTKSTGGMSHNGWYLSYSFDSSRYPLKNEKIDCRIFPGHAKDKDSPFFWFDSMYLTEDQLNQIDFTVDLRIGDVHIELFKIDDFISPQYKIYLTETIFNYETVNYVSYVDASFSSDVFTENQGEARLAICMKNRVTGQEQVSTAKSFNYQKHNKQLVLSIS